MSDERGFHIGALVGEPPDRSVHLPADQFCTHGVILGMTGSGKTGLGIVTLEEAARASIPTLVVDPKGDLGNLALNFAGREPSAFDDWVDERDAARATSSDSAATQSVSEQWRRGLSAWGLDFDGDARLRNERVDVLTPGAPEVRPLNLLGSLAAPGGDGSAGVDDECEALVTGLLRLIQLDADPLTSRPCLLLSALVRRAWLSGRDLSWVELLSQVLDPPLRKLGVFALNDFYPESERRELASRLNGLLASPRFAAFGTGAALDFDDAFDLERPRTTVLYLAHLSDDERQLVVSLVLGKLLRWMRSQPGSRGLRALVYMDEVAGYAPPTASPSTKKPLLTLLKQARAYGVGLLLSSQNPVDLDYKALSNAGTWFLGRLHTKQDRARVLAGIGGPQRALDRELAGLEKRQFVLVQTRKPEPEVVRVRHAISYLRGPLTLSEVARLPRPEEAADVAKPSPPPPAPAEDDALPLMPKVARGVPIRYLHASAAWAREMGMGRQDAPLSAGLCTRVRMRFDDRASQLDAVVEWEAVWLPWTGTETVRDAQQVDYDERDFRSRPPSDARYHATDADLGDAGALRALQRQLVKELVANERMQLWRCKAVSLYGRPGESESAFRERVKRAAEEHAEREAGKLQSKYAKRVSRLREKLRDAEARAEDLEERAKAQSQSEWLSGAASVVGMFFGGRSSLRGLGSAARRRSQTQAAKRRAQRQVEKLTSLEEQIDALEDELSRELEEVTDRWLDRRDEVEQLEVGLEKNDVHVEELALFWAPLARAASHD